MSTTSVSSTSTITSMEERSLITSRTSAWKVDPRAISPTSLLIFVTTPPSGARRTVLSRSSRTCSRVAWACSWLLIAVSYEASSASISWRLMRFFSKSCTPRSRSAVTWRRRAAAERRPDRERSNAASDRSRSRMIRVSPGATSSPSCTSRPIIWALTVEEISVSNTG